MKMRFESPWASGPGEILRHGLSLLDRDSDTNRRLAMISIDNSVELMIKTYLGLPKRISGLAITRKRLQEISESFPALLDGLEEFAQDKLDGIDLGAIEWYHRLRNELYHQGNGLTVEGEKVEVYAEIANTLFRNLFGESLISSQPREMEMLGEFMASWVLLESGLRAWAARNTLLGQERVGVFENIRFLRDSGIIEDEQYRELDSLRKLRNQVTHSQIDYKNELNKEIVARVKFYASIFDEESA